MSDDFSGNVVVERPSDFVALIRFNRLDKKNALHSSMIVELGRVLSRFQDDDAIRCVVLTGTEDFFAAGADIKEMVSFGPLDVANAPARVAAWAAIERFKKPIIAAVNGVAFGAGCELALLSDFIIAGDNAQFGQPEVRLGSMPGDGGTQRLPRKLSPNLAAYLTITGEAIGAEQAARLGLVVEVVSPAETVDRAVAIASVVSSRPPLAVQAIKSCINAAVGANDHNGLAFERDAVNRLAMTADAKEGMKAFAEKRPPNFTGQ
ncbi:2,3-dehydroadipyl-CoA hydratase [Mesorhizobium hawassense]|uniref:2,3-dehydroadipyl-CoA hydratase n=1 Tax=Mesorhizobium hawassense TaxID=1209954 RepID=A0A330HPC5_9HYPH|nr:enoyl-CoA hydratase-related protein [Mesorhizobium hawassense]RAZ89412.1 2,3-dehydroadipyl-CoA hydratase [Mesorhizobium hawassense]